MTGLRQTLRSLRRFWGNRKALPKVLEMLCHDAVEPASLSAARRLIARGHSRTAHERIPVSSNGSAVPWYTYPFHDYLLDLDCSTWKVIEFGSGQSTLFWASRAASVLAYEHSDEWKQKLLPQCPENVEIRLFEGEQTLGQLAQLEFVPDLVVVDGWKRGACAIRSIEAFGLEPLYVLENSDWFPQAAAAMRAAGLVEVRFKGFGPINGYAWVTSLMISQSSLKRLASVSKKSDVPGGLDPGNYEQQDLDS